MSENEPTPTPTPTPTPESTPSPTPSPEPTPNQDDKPFYNESHVKKIIEEKRQVLKEKQDLLDENKRLKMEKFEKEENWKAIAESDRKELDEYKSNMAKKDEIISRGVKTSALKRELTKLGCQEKFLDKAIKLVDLNSVQYDLDTNVVTGHSELAKQLADDVPPFFQGATVGVDHGSPAGFPVDLTIDNWKAMPRGPEKDKAKEQLYKQAGFERRK